MAGEEPDRRGRSRFKKQQLWRCSTARDGRDEEELTLTPHHTPSQSFDFIVWDRAYLDTIPAAMATSQAVDPREEQLALISSPARCSADAIAGHGAAPAADPTPGTASLTIPTHDPVLLSCRTDADLPACLSSSKPRISDGSYGLTNLEAAVRRYARRNPLNLAGMSLPGADRISNHASSEKLQQLRPVEHLIKELRSADHHHHQDVLLMRSLSQPGLDSADSGSEATPAAINGRRELSGSTAAPALRRQRRVFCLPTSPGRRTKQSGNSTSRISTLQQEEKLAMPRRQGDDRHHLQERNFMASSLRTTQITEYGKHRPSPELAACRSPIIGRRTPMQEDLDRGYSSSSEISSLRSSNHDHQAAAAPGSDNMGLKLKLWRVHNRVKAFCKKLCSPF